MDLDPSASQFCVARLSLASNRWPRPHSSRQDDSHMIDLGFAALLALISAGFGKRVLDGLGQFARASARRTGTGAALGHGADRPGDARPGRVGLP